MRARGSEISQTASDIPDLHRYERAVVWNTRLPIGVPSNKRLDSVELGERLAVPPGALRERERQRKRVIDRLGDSASRVAMRIPRAGLLEIVAGGRTGSVRVVESVAVGWIAEAVAARARGDHAAAERLARPHLEDGDATARARAAGIVARARLAEGRISEAIALLRQASIAAGAAGRISEAVDDALALSFTLSQRA
ncbi:MAG TPA: hypothetical protein VM580_34200, partial [Labilithrix sp.]|nr:hypothetical protein [Labilithrix sp.]